MWKKYFDQNKTLWNNKFDVNFKSKFYDMEGFLSGKSSLTEIEANALGDVNGKSLLHLQCHFGQDTLSWARQGAVVTGVDFSDKSIDAARSLAGDLNLDARFILSNVYDVPEVLDEKFDIVFSTFGAIPWLPDLEKWASIVNRYLKPSGIFYLAEFHPTFYLFNFDNFQVEYGYFTEKEPYSEEVTGTYADRYADIKGKEYFWNHSISEVMTPLLKEGLQVLDFQEYDFSPYQCFPNMTEREPGRYTWGNFGVRLPHIFSLKMRMERDER